MLWVKALHIVFMVAWFAGIFYLPRLFVYHAMSHDQVSLKRFEVMEHKLFWGIMTPSAILTVIFGFWLLYEYAWSAYKHMGWLHAKLACVFLLLLYHVSCWYFLRAFKQGKNRHGHVWYRVYNEIPVVLLLAITCLVVVKPF